MKLAENIVKDGTGGLARALKGDYAFINDVDGLYGMVAELEDCSLHIAKERFFRSGYGFPFQNGSPYLDVINNA